MPCLLSAIYQRRLLLLCHRHTAFLVPAYLPTCYQHALPACHLQPSEAVFSPPAPGSGAHWRFACLPVWRFAVPLPPAAGLRTAYSRAPAVCAAPPRARSSRARIACRRETLRAPRRRRRWRTTPACRHTLLPAVACSIPGTHAGCRLRWFMKRTKDACRTPPRVSRLAARYRLRLLPPCRHHRHRRAGTARHRCCARAARARAAAAFRVVRFCARLPPRRFLRGAVTRARCRKRRLFPLPHVRCWAAPRVFTCLPAPPPCRPLLNALTGYRCVLRARLCRRFMPFIPPLVPRSAYCLPPCHLQLYLPRWQRRRTSAFCRALL